MASGRTLGIASTTKRSALAIFDKSASTRDILQYHVRVRPGDVADYVLLPGDPARVGLIAEHLDEPREVACHREYRTVTGSFRGIGVSATSTGIGCPSAAIAVEELCNVGASHFIRVGSSAAFVEGINPGDILINTAAMRLDGTSATYVDEGFPAVADHFLVRALIDSAVDLAPELGFATHVGLNVTSDAFYAESPEWVERMIEQRIMNVEWNRRRSSRSRTCAMSRPPWSVRCPTTSPHPPRSTTRA